MSADVPQARPEGQAAAGGAAALISYLKYILLHALQLSLP
jgi:hypothetical protein